MTEKIIVVGNSDGSRSSLIAYNADGSLDTTFGSGGQAVAPGLGNPEYPLNLVTQSDGKVVVVGFKEDGGGNSILLVRFNADGSVDSGFGAGGEVNIIIRAGGIDEATDVAIQSDGKIVASGFSTDGSGLAKFVVLRCTQSGGLDSTFGTGGIVKTDFHAGNAYGSAVALQSDGKILVAGQVQDASNTTAGLAFFGVARYNTDGSLDGSFGSGGKLTTSITPEVSFDTAEDLAIQSDGKIIVVGYSYNQVEHEVVTVFALIRYNTDGSVDSSFGTNGKVTTNFGADSEIGPGRENEAFGVTIQGDGKIVVVGWTTTFLDAIPVTVVALARYNTDGSLDSSFGSGGKVTTSFGSGATDRAFGVAIKSDGKILVGCDTLPDVTPVVGLACYNSNGSLDSSFGAGGLVTNSGVNSAYSRVLILADEILDGTGKMFLLPSYLATVEVLDPNMEIYLTDGRRVAEISVRTRMGRSF